MRARPLVLSVAALSLLVLAGCAAPDEEQAPTAGAPADLCEAAVASGDAAESVRVSGEVGEEPTVDFDAPLEITELERTVVVEGTGPALAAGQLADYAVTTYDTQTGEPLQAAGYAAGEFLPEQVSPDSVLGQIFGCANVGSRVVATFPATEGDVASSAVFVLDLLGVTPAAAWGEDQDPAAGLPAVSLDADGAPTIAVPDAEAPDEVQIETLKLGDGTEVLPGDNVLVQYTGVTWSDGSVFDSSWDRGAPTSFATTQVVEGFGQALEGQAVGSQVLAVIPPAAGYGASEGHELQEETLVFVVDILATQHPAG